MKKKIFILSLFLMVVVLGISFGNNQLDVQKNDTVLPLPAYQPKKIASPDEKGSFIIRLHSSGHSRHPPADLLIEDSEGLKTGYNPITGVYYSEIPRSSYESLSLIDLDTGERGPITKELEIMQPSAGDYNLYVIGTNTGTKTVGADISIGFDGGGQRPRDVNKFLSYARPSKRQTTLPAGTTNYIMIILYGDTIIPSTFNAELNGMDITSLFNPAPGGTEAVTLNLKEKRGQVSGFWTKVSLFGVADCSFKISSGNFKYKKIIQKILLILSVP
jgi:hypothetical protein